MRSERLEALLWERIDGEITDADRAELEAHLAEHREARELEEELVFMARRLDEIAEVEPPQELRPLIDDALAAANPPRHEPESRRIKGPTRPLRPVRPDNPPTFRPPAGTWGSEVNNNRTTTPGHVPGKGVSMAESKKGIIGAFVAVAVIGIVAIGYFSLNQAPAIPEDAAGAVGAADRYRAEQITAEDVQIEQVELQAFLQTDEFDQLVNDPETRKLLASEAMQRAMSDASFNAAMKNSRFHAAMNDANFLAAMQDANFQAAMQDANLRRRRTSPVAWPRSRAIFWSQGH